jgi:uncharacterized protein YjbI with pentapeptide repeats
MLLQGAHFSDSDLRGADFRGADVYWGIFFLADLTSANFERVNYKVPTLSRPISLTQI